MERLSIDEIAQSIYGKPSDELTAIEYRICETELKIYLDERNKEEQYSRSCNG
jgi:hypothetical protein